MDTQSYKTVSLKAGDIKKEWVVIDATDLVVGRLAAILKTSVGFFAIISLGVVKRCPPG